MSERLNRLRTVMDSRNLDSVLITHPNNRFYLSGYSGDDDPPNESAGVLLVSTNSELLLTGATNEAWAQAEAPEWTVQRWDRPWTSTVAKILGDSAARRVGFEENAMNVSTYNELTAALSDGVELVPLGDAVEQFRLVKDDFEEKAVAAVIELTDRAFAAATNDLHAGVTERDLAWRIERTIHESGADGLAFPVIVAAGPHAARPHHNPTIRQIQNGEPIIIDMGARLAGYNGDLTRTIWVGSPEE
ncbi:MAG: Xaa-Pro peptidase family protein, partial [Chloroflexota bacterium]|nr:Xaa-Pro peptidase family protein [Chloroflexota bacterium]